MVSYSRKDLKRPSIQKEPQEDLNLNSIDHIQAKVNLDLSPQEKLSNNENKYANDFKNQAHNKNLDKSKNHTPQSSQLSVAQKITRNTVGGDGTGFYNPHNNSKRQTSKKQSAIKNYAEVANSLLPTNNI